MVSEEEERGGGGDVREEEEGLRARVACLEKWDLMTDEQEVLDLKAEIERLKGLLETVDVSVQKLRKARGAL